ncbi:biotin-independent malonate decarboxylase subunit gamma [Acinetobacter larvae]|uniref:Biotin-independent malonate decarboxylase subunit gamma n=1 Tax=Acinetobacter larvae TaxID=1789224 RepID=A0A1B2LXX7_9GAMM|nr:biotin-independent malonate decarboxylase subunit gamma [Acinetobacter larvae]AOA57822.1 biotin-independent malonate decarboxylase subunit gamma [Acinetobacter larvae]
MHLSTRGLDWFQALTENFQIRKTAVASVQAADGDLLGYPVRVIAVVADPQNLYPRARQGEVGLLEGWALAQVVDDLLQQGLQHAQQQKPSEAQHRKRAILCIVDVPSQAYGRREEQFGIHQALAAAVDHYVQARLAGHPIVSLLVGKSMSGAFLAHGYQANRIIALNDPEVMVHAMGKVSAARVTLRSVEELEAWAAQIAPMAYDIASYNSLGLLAACLDVSNPDQPSAEDVALVRAQIHAQIQDILQQARVDFAHRYQAKNRQASQHVRQLMAAQWS